MEQHIEKVTLTLDRQILEEMSAKAKKSMSEYVRDLIAREKQNTELEISVSPEILELKGILEEESTDSFKNRLHQSAKRILR